MLVRRFYDQRLAQASYLVACQRTGEAIVIDPARHIAPYLDAAADERVRITRVAETHIHADFVSGARELASATGARLMLSAEGGADWQYRYAAADGAALLHDGDVIAMGGVRIEVWHTPGHTPEHLVYLVTDTSRSDEPVALVSGDLLFVGDVGRPDLLERAAGVAGTMQAGARQLFRSLGRLSALPDHLQVWPGHGAGSACGKALGALPTSTLGYERRTNWAFGVTDQDAFVEAVLEGQPAPPGYFGRMKQTNRDGPPLLGPSTALPKLPAASIAEALARGTAVDLRAADDYAAAHLRGTLSIPLNRAFTTWAGWLLPPGRPLYLLASDEESGLDARIALQSIGLDSVEGVLFWPELAATHGAVMRATQRGRMADAESLHAGGWQIIDVRDTDEWDAGHLPAARHHALGTLMAAVTEQNRATPIAVHCESGSRSAIAASLLERLGFDAVIDLTDGWSAWTDSDVAL